MSEPLYNIEEMQTDGWKEPDQYCHGLTRAEAKEKYDWLVNTESLNPNRSVSYTHLTLPTILLV